MKRESELKEEIDELKKTKSSNEKEIQILKTRESKSSEENEKVKSSSEKEIQRLRNELQQQTTFLEQERQKSAMEKGSSAQLISNLGHRVANKIETIDSLKREIDVYQAFLQSKNNEIKDLKGNLELKRQLEEYQRRSQPLIYNSNSTNDDNNNNATTNNTTELDNQVPLSDAPDRSLDDIRVKTEAESENDSSPSCQIGNKKRKVTSNYS